MSVTALSSFDFWSSVGARILWLICFPLLLVFTLTTRPGLECYCFPCKKEKNPLFCSLTFSVTFELSNTAFHVSVCLHNMCCVILTATCVTKHFPLCVIVFLWNTTFSWKHPSDRFSEFLRNNANHLLPVFVLGSASSSFAYNKLEGDCLRWFGLKLDRVESFCRFRWVRSP